MISDYLKNWKVQLLIVLVVASALTVGFKGLKLGIDFKGGTLFQLHLAEPATPQEMAVITQVIASRVDASGLQGATVLPAGNEFVIATISDTDPEVIDSIQRLLSKQGRLENILEGEIVFTGKNVLKESTASQSGLGVTRQGEGVYHWQYPFTLDLEGARNFTRAIHNGCDNTGVNCKATYFFIDRPTDSVLVMPSSILEAEEAYLSTENTSISDLLENARLQALFVEGRLTGSQLESINTNLSTALVHPSISSDDRNALTAAGFDVKEIQPATKKFSGEPMESWLWNATKVRAVISLSPGITNNGIPEDQLDNYLHQSLVIQGTADSAKTASERRNEIRIILKSGSLPIPVDDISKNSVSPTLGSSFLQNILLAGGLSLLAVAVFIFALYRKPHLAVPIILVSFSEVVIILGFASLTGWSLDLAAMAGIIAAIGTGVDNQIVITDELLKRKTEENRQLSLQERVKGAFFIVFAGASTIIATMLPVVFFGLGLGKLTGFAIITIFGTLVGVFVARPAYGEIAKLAISKREHHN